MRGELAVYLGVLWIGSVMLQLPVVGPDAAPAVAETETDPASTSMDKYVFPSYARRDQAIVEETMAWVEPLGLEYWQDLRMLRSGDVWSERLRELITNAGRFQLFWSDAAQRSGEVANEYRYALELRKPIRGSYWQSPPPPFPGRTGGTPLRAAAGPRWRSRAAVDSPSRRHMRRRRRSGGHRTRRGARIPRRRRPPRPRLHRRRARRRDPAPGGCRWR